MKIDKIIQSVTINSVIFFLLAFIYESCSAYKAGSSFQHGQQWTPELSLNPRQIFYVGVSPDGEKTLSVTNDENLKDPKSQCTIWENKSKKVLFASPTGEDCKAATWSPDGKWLSLVFLENERFILKITSSSKYEPITVLSFHSMQNVQWSPDGKKISFLSSGEEELPLSEREKVVEESTQKITPMHLYLMDMNLSHKTFSKPYPVSSSTFTIEDYKWSPDSQRIAFSFLPNEVDSYTSFIGIINIASGKMKKVTDEGRERSPIFSPDGKTLAFIASFIPAVHKDITVKSGGFLTGPQRICLLTLADGKKRFLAKTPNESPRLVGWDLAGRALIVEEWNKTRRVFYSFPIDGKAPTCLNKEGLNSFYFASFNVHRTFLGFMGEGPILPPEIYISAFPHFQPIQISNFHKNLPSIQPLRFQTIQWKSFDGKIIEGLLILPPNYTKGQHPVPLFVAIHGGPQSLWNKEYLGFQSGGLIPFALLAQEGFAIFAPNVRGSDGYGAAFRQANYRNFGGGDFKDMMTGVDFLIAKGIANPQKLAIGGWSYGGYMAAWAITQTNRFKAAIVGAGVVNLISDTGNNADSTNEFMKTYYGEHFWKIPQIYLDSSPLIYIQNAQTPTLILHGEKDRNVPPTQSYEFYRALKERKVPVKFVIYKEQDHGLKRKAAINTIEESLKWLKNYVKP